MRHALCVMRWALGVGRGKGFTPLHPENPVFQGVGVTGFTLIEVMVATIIASSALLMIYQSFMTSLNTSNHLLNRMLASLEASNELWRIDDMLRQTKDIDINAVELQYPKKIITALNQYTLDLHSQPLDSLYNFYQMDLQVKWLENKKEITLSRSIYAHKKIDF